MLSLQALRNCAFKSAEDHKLQDINAEFASESKFAKLNFFSLHKLWVTIPLGAAAGGIPVCLVTRGEMIYQEGKALTH